MVLCLGQVVIDFISLEEGVPLPAVARFAPCLGGSAANVAVGLHHHGVPVRLCSRVGQDDLGRAAVDSLAAHGLDTTGVTQDPDRPTRFTRIGVDAAGEPAMEVHNLKSADQAITGADVPPGALAEARTFHFGGTMLLSETGFRTTLDLLHEARRRGVFVAFDPNVRPSRTRDPARIRSRLGAVLPLVDLLQTSRSDWDDLWGDRTPQALLGQGLGLLVQTDGARGASLRTRHQAVEVAAEPVAVVDATGAGDAFLAALLARVAARLTGLAVADLPAEELQDWGRVAAAWAARILRHRGAVTAYRSGPLAARG